jgi:hypothetical protein
MIYEPGMTLRDARVLHFERSGFPPDGGYDGRWIKVKVWRVPVRLPNTPGRRRAVRLHDLHHVLTEYPTTWRGEAEISAWEIASGGLRRYWAGWVLDLMNVAQGLVVNPRGAFRAFVRGRRSRNLFGETFGDALLARRVGEVRREMLLDDGGAGAAAKATAGDVAAFVAWSLAGAATYLVAVALPLAPFALVIYLTLRLTGAL